jgi:hypothetical protein
MRSGSLGSVSFNDKAAREAAIVEYGVAADA